MWKMCDAWLLLPRHGPDGTRAHTGYAYEPLGWRCDPKVLDTSQALVLQPPSLRSASLACAQPVSRQPVSQPYAH
jgi:hypothetical protein